MTRLTPLDSQANNIGVAGATANGDGGRLQVSFPAGTFDESTDMRVTNVSPQGLANLLPYGWSPVPGAVVDLRPASSGAAAPQAFPASAHLTISQVSGLTSATPLTLVRYDETSHRWMVVAAGLYATGDNGALAADLPRTGQYAFLVADTGLTAPPPAVVGQPLTAAQPADSAALDSAQASAVATPRTAVFSSSARSAISFFATAPTQLPSGVTIDATFGETYQEYTSPTDNSPQPFRSTFKTFRSLVLTETPPDTDSYRIAAAGDLAITMTPGPGSTMHIWDITNPDALKLMSSRFVPNYATVFDIADAELDEDTIKLDNSPGHPGYGTIAVVASVNTQDTSRPINLSAGRAGQEPEPHRKRSADCDRP